MPASGRLARLADLAYRRRGRTLVAWIVLTAAVVAIAPRLAGDFSSEFATAGSESQAAADLIAERFPGISGDTIEVVWQAPAGVRAPGVRARVERFLARAQRLDGIATPQRARVSPDGTIALTRLELDRRALDLPEETAKRMIELAQAASRDGLRIELGGPPIRNAQEGAARRSWDSSPPPSSCWSPSDRWSRSGCRSRSRSSGSASRCC